MFTDSAAPKPCENLGPRITGRITLRSPATSQPVIADGWSYVGTDGGLIAINTGDPGLTGWNQWGGNAAPSGVARPRPDAGATARAGFGF
jgi:hypothetical protein